MPLELSDFPEEIQVAFFMFSLLPDHWEGMSGTYMGKYWDGIDYFFKLYEVQNPKVVFYFMKIYENKLVQERSNLQTRKRKQQESRAKSASGSNKNYTHNVQG